MPSFFHLHAHTRSVNAGHAKTGYGLSMFLINQAGPHCQLLVYHYNIRTTRGQDMLAGSERCWAQFVQT